MINCFLEFGASWEFRIQPNKLKTFHQRSCWYGMCVSNKSHIFVDMENTYKEILKFCEFEIKNTPKSLNTYNQNAQNESI